MKLHLESRSVEELVEMSRADHQDGPHRNPCGVADGARGCGYWPVVGCQGKFQQRAVEAQMIVKVGRRAKVQIQELAVWKVAKEFPQCSHVAWN